MAEAIQINFHEDAAKAGVPALEMGKLPAAQPAGAPGPNAPLQHQASYVDPDEDKRVRRSSFVRQQTKLNKPEAKGASHRWSVLAAWAAVVSFCSASP